MTVQSIKTDGDTETYEDITGWTTDRLKGVYQKRESDDNLGKIIKDSIGQEWFAGDSFVVKL